MSSSNSRTAVSADIGLGLVGPEQTIVPLMASLYYSCHDPYAVKMAFHVGTDQPVEWVLARDLLAAARPEPRAGLLPRSPGRDDRGKDSLDQVRSGFGVGQA